MKKGLPEAHHHRLLAIPLLLAVLLTACADGAPPRPNVLWIIWDTVRADRMSVYGHYRPTTPRLAEWSEGARVYTNVISAAGYTLPSHASMFTGMLPSQHCTNNESKRLSRDYTTIAELLSREGYGTYLYSANPHISKGRQFDQGFDLVEHPWSPRYKRDALQIVMSKLLDSDASSELPQQLNDAIRGEGALAPWNIKAAGALAERALLDWLGSRDGERPFFAFLNYMEAHRPMIPSREARRRVMSEEDVELSYDVDRSWGPMWEYTFGLREYTRRELELTRSTYDATLTELDELLANLLASLQERGYLDDTIVILSADHGEHLGEQHMMDHQYSLYEPLLRIPLIVHYPKRFAPGRDASPVMNFDIFATLLDLLDLEAPETQAVDAVSLLAPDAERLRLAEDPSGTFMGDEIAALHPDWDPAPWERRQRAVVDGTDKYIWNSRGHHSVFDLSQDPMEERNLVGESRGREIAARLQVEMDENFGALACRPERRSTGAEGSGISPEEKELLRALGYVEESEPNTDPEPEE